MAQGLPGWVILLPGPPRELHPMFDYQVAPFLRENCVVDYEFASRTLRVSGIGESAVEERVMSQLGELVALGLELGYCAKPGEVDVRLSFRGESAEQRLVEAHGIVTGRLGNAIFAEGETLLEEVVVGLLREKRKTLATAESCTGGHISNRVTNVSGASEVFLAGLVTYSNAAKMKFLGVQNETLEAYGAVSEAVAREMAEGLKRETGADFAISTTGIAGPTGGTPDKPVGTVFVGITTPTEVEVHKFMHPFDRETFKNITAQRALDLVRKKLLVS